MRRLGWIAVVLVLVGAACSSSGYTQEDLDAAAAEAVDAALATTSTVPSESPDSTTTTKGEVTTSTEAEGTKTTPTESTTTTGAVEPDEIDPRSAEAIVGNEAPPLSAGEEGEISVIGHSFTASDTGREFVYLIVRNNTGEQVKGIEVAFTIRDGAGALVASGDNTGGMFPYRVIPGGVAFGYSYLTDAVIPTNARFEFQVVSSDEPDSTDWNIDMVVVEHGKPGESVIGIIDNQSEGAVHSVRSGAMCFHEDGRISTFWDHFADQDELEPGETSPVAIRMFDNECPIYLMAATARYQD